MATAVAPSSVGDPFLDHVAVVDDDSDDDSDALADELEADLVEAEARRARRGSVVEETKRTYLRCGGALGEGCAASRARASASRPRDAPS